MRLSGRFSCRFAGWLLLCNLLLRSTASGSGASGHLIDEAQPDGTPVRLRNAGGEWFHWHETDDGYVVAKDLDGFWKHCRPREDSGGLEIIAEAVVGRVSPSDLALRKRDLPSSRRIREQIDRLQGRRETPLSRPGEARGLELGVPPATPPPPSSGAQAEGSAAAISFDSRTVKCIVILAAFDDHWDELASTVLAAKGRPASEYDPLFNKVDYKVAGTAGSVRDFYLENSYHRLVIDTVIAGWVRLPRTESWYGDNANEVEGEQRSRQLVLVAIMAAHAAGFDFSQGDGDGDGFVDLLHVIHSGHSEAYSGNPSTSMWPRFWSLKNNRVILDGVGLSDFSLSCALRGSADTSTSLCRVGEICHELGHQFGLPDLYDVGGKTQGVGTWCCMGGGNWGAISGPTYDGRQPVQVSAHC